MHFYDQEEKRDRDNYSIIETHRREGLREGLKEGEKKGRKEGREETEQGIRKVLLQKGMTEEEIKTILSLSRKKKY